MANPPITIGPFTNVPAPGSPIRSDWAQQITNYVQGPTYTTVAALKADTWSRRATLVLAGVPIHCFRDGSNAWVGEYTNSPAAKTTDANGVVTWTAAQLNFVTLLAAVANVAFSFGTGANLPQFASARINANQLEVRCFAVSATNTVTFVQSTAVTVLMTVRGVL